MKRWLILVLLLLSGCNLNTAPSPIPPTQITPTLGITPTVQAPVVTTTANPLNNALPATDAAEPIGERTVTLAVTSTASISDGVPFPTNYINSYSISARKGQTIYVNYEAVVENPGGGRVFLLVHDPEGKETARFVITETANDVVEVSAEVTGDYTLFITPENLRGSYKTSYGTR